MQKIPRVISHGPRLILVKKSQFTHFLPQFPASHSYPTDKEIVTGRRSGLKIRRPLRPWGFDPPSRHQQNKAFRLKWPLEIGEAKIVWWLFWWLLVLTENAEGLPALKMSHFQKCFSSLRGMAPHSTNQLLE